MLQGHFFLGWRCCALTTSVTSVTSGEMVPTPPLDSRPGSIGRGTPSAGPAGAGSISMVCVDFQKGVFGVCMRCVLFNGEGRINTIRPRDSYMSE